jgi:hypothetical protein
MYKQYNTVYITFLISCSFWGEEYSPRSAWGKNEKWPLK